VVGAVHRDLLPSHPLKHGNFLCLKSTLKYTLILTVGVGPSSVMGLNPFVPIEMVTVFSYTDICHYSADGKNSASCLLTLVYAWLYKDLYRSVQAEAEFRILTFCQNSAAGFFSACRICMKFYIKLCLLGIQQQKSYFEILPLLCTAFLPVPTVCVCVYFYE